MQGERHLYLRHCLGMLCIGCLLGAPLWAAPLRDFGWQLHCRDAEHIQKTLEQAVEYGVTEIRLSHSIITAVDQLGNDPALVKLVNTICAFCDAHGMDTFVWAKELNIGQRNWMQDLDPEGGGKVMWDTRRAAYRTAFENCPSLDGVVLQFGSCPTEIWQIAPFASQYNAETSCPDRVALTVGIVKEVCDAYGKKLDVRTFNHSPTQQQCMQEGLKKCNGVRAMIKEVPQDWQPYYPQNPLIGDVGENESLVEFDLGAEYWGGNHVPFVLVDYLCWRMGALVPRTITGVVVRAERGCRPTLSSSNEVNLYAMSRLIHDPTCTPDEIWQAWIKERYGLSSETEAAQALRTALELSFDIGRKMFYVREHWALEKGSNIPDRVVASCLQSKNIGQWNPAYRDAWNALCKPTAETLTQIWQEKTEALELARRAQALVAQVAPALNDADRTVLQQQMQAYVYYTQIWRYIVDAIFRIMHYAQTQDGQDLPYLEGDARGLEALRKETKDLSLSLAEEKRLNSFISDLRTRFPKQESAEELQLNVLSEIRVTTCTATTATITWRSEQPGQGRVYYGLALPDLPKQATETDDTQSQHQVTLSALQPNTRYTFRVGTGSVLSGDYTFQTTPEK